MELNDDEIVTDSLVIHGGTVHKVCAVCDTPIETSSWHHASFGDDGKIALLCSKDCLAEWAAEH